MKNLVLLFNGTHSIAADMNKRCSLSLMALSAYLKQNAFNCKIINFDIKDFELLPMLNEALAVGMSVLTGTGIMVSLALAARIRRLAPQLPVVWGGVHPTMECEQSLAKPLVDYVVRGEGEITFAELLQALQNNDRDRLHSIPGLSFKEQGNQIHNPPRVASDISAFPLLDYELYSRDCFQDGIIPYISSRGCPYKCRFCCSASLNRVHGKRFMQMDIPRVARDLDTIIDKYSPRAVYFFDDAFLMNRARIKEVIETFKTRRYAFEWYALSRCDVFAKLDDETLSDLKEIHVKKLFLGVESASPRILEYIDKQIHREDVIAAVTKLAKHGIETDFSFMNGFPGETRADVYENLRLRREIKEISPSATVTFSVYTPQPGTDLYAECMTKYNLPRKATLESWADGYEYHTSRPGWLPFTHRNMINIIAWASFFDVIGVHSSIALSSFGEFVLKLLRIDSRIRLNKFLLSFGLEYMILNCYTIRKTRRFLEQCRRTIMQNKNHF